MTIKFSLAKCKTKAAYSAKLQQKGKIDLKKIKDQFEVLMETPILLVVKTKAGEVIVHSHGEILFKGCKDVELMESISKSVYKIGLSN
jgi:hypothetical protein